jgi:hypothetical protein
MRTTTMLLVPATCVLLLLGCDLDKSAKLEKQVKDLQAKQAAEEYDLRGKCSRDAKAWFQENWGSRDKDTILLTETNHYNKRLNKCFVLVEYHFNYQGQGAWVNDMSMWDVQENSKYADFMEFHGAVTLESLKSGDRDRIDTCVVYGTHCASLQDFNRLTTQYMND